MDTSTIASGSGQALTQSAEAGLTIDREPENSDWSDTEEFDKAYQQAKDDRKQDIVCQGTAWTPDVERREMRNIERNFLTDYCRSRASDGHSRKHFICEAHHSSGQQCRSNQEYGPSTQNSRAIISDFFGRNKNNFQQIPKKYIVLACRKDYQTMRYNNDAKAYALIKLSYIALMLEKLEQFAPDARYHVQLQKSLQAKHDAFVAAVRRNQLSLIHI